VASSGSAAIELVDATAGYGGPPVLQRMNVRIEPGELVGAVGPSGSGKTTLLRLLTGTAELYGGHAELFGQPVRRGRPPSRVGLVPQIEAVDWDFPLTVEQVVLLGLTDRSSRTPWFRRGERHRARDLLERLGIAEHADRHIGELSGGQRQRAFLARAMVREATLILLDEPTSGVDLQTRHDVLHLLGELNADGLTVLLTTHDLNWVAGHLPRVVCMNQTVVADGAPEEIFTPETLRATYGADVRILEHEDLVVVVDRGAILPRGRRPTPDITHHAAGEPHVHPTDADDHVHPTEGGGSP
jgi:zinc/manganese transport system ATP-binding protein